MIRYVFVFLFFLSGLSYGEKISFNILHINDVYEFFPVGGGTKGGLARVATIQKKLLEKNSHTVTIIAGDFLSPSPMSAVKMNHKFLAGKQMIDILNTMNLDYATFGNHEFDLKEDELLERVQESKFTWFTSNVLDSKTRKRWPKVEGEVSFNIAGGSKTLHVGMFGVTLPKAKKPYVYYEDFFKASEESVHKLRKDHDVVIALTHLSIEDDMKLVDSIPGIDLVLGGHDHENMYFKRGVNFTTIAKADGNAKSVYIHELIYDTETKHLEVKSELVVVNDEIASEPKVEERVVYWKKIASDFFKKEKDFDLDENLAIALVDLDARREAIRYKSNHFTQFLGDCMRHEAGEVEASMYSIGMVRIDDLISKGTIVSNYDLLRMMPYPEDVSVIKITGSLLIRALDQGAVKNKGGGGFLHLSKIEKNSNHWTVNGAVIKPESSYHIAVNSFLISGAEVGLPFLTAENNPDLIVVEKKRLFLKAIADCIKSETRHHGNNFSPLH